MTRCVHSGETMELMQTLMKQTTDPEKKKDRSDKTKNVRWPENKEIKT